jgi:hypothetical protein
MPSIAIAVIAELSVFVAKAAGADFGYKIPLRECSLNNFLY